MADDTEKKPEKSLLQRIGAEIVDIGEWLLDKLILDPHQRALNALVDDLGLTRGYPATQQLKIQHMLDMNWIEPWYQPKIDLNKRCLVGAEIFARARHPEHGMLGSGCVLANATESDLLLLTSYMIAAALRDWREFADLAPEMKIAVNIPVGALTKLPIAAIVRDNRPKHRNWPKWNRWLKRAQKTLPQSSPPWASASPSTIAAWLMIRWRG